MMCTVSPFYAILKKVCNENSFQESYVYKGGKEESVCRSLKNCIRRIIRKFTSIY